MNEAAMRSRDRHEFRDAAEFTIVGFRTFEGPAVDDFDGVQNLPDVSADQNGMKGAYR